MNKSFRTGILAFMLVLPVFVFLFLYQFGDNKFKIPVMLAEDSVQTEDGYVVTSAHTIPDYKFITSQGTTLTNKDLSNSVYVAEFFFSTCPSICKTMTSQLVRVQESFKANDQVKIVSFSVDPENDTPEVLDRYAKAHRAMPGKWFFLTGEKDSIHSLAGRKGFLLNVVEDSTGVERFTHDNHFVLIDKKGWIRGFYDGLDPKDVDRLITEIKILLLEYDNK